MTTTTAETYPRTSGPLPFIGGHFVRTPDLLTVRSPATGAVVAEVGTCSVPEIERAVDEARAAFDARVWSSTSARDRAAVVLRMVELLKAEESALVDAVVAQTGCPRGLAARLQVGKPLDQARAMVEAFLSLPDTTANTLPLSEIVGTDHVTTSVMRYGPVGVVAAISAYNFPLQLEVWKVLPALLAGNTVVLRPSPLTPLTALRLAAAAQAAGLPPGVLNVVVERGAEGAVLMTTHPSVDMVSFTGSSAVGRSIATQAAPTLKRVLLELGGKSVGLYLPEALAGVGAGVAAMMTTHAGQACVAQSRVLVPRERYDEAVDLIRGSLATLRVGDPEDPAVTVGPLISAARARAVLAHVDGARAQGATLLAGGGHPAGLPAHLDREAFVEPTLLGCADQTVTAAREEIFGPVVCLLGYDDLDHAVALANDSSYALSAGVYGGPAAALAVAERLDAGTVVVNRGFASAHVSSGGWKQSGTGRERGVEGLRAFQRLKHLAISH